MCAFMCSGHISVRIRERKSSEIISPALDSHCPMARDNACTFTVPRLKTATQHRPFRPTVCGSNVLTSFRQASKPVPRAVFCTMSNASPSRALPVQRRLVDLFPRNRDFLRRRQLSTWVFPIVRTNQEYLLTMRPLLRPCPRTWMPSPSTMLLWSRSSTTLKMLETRWMICEVLVPRVPVPSVLPLLRSDSRSLTSLPIDLATRSLSFFLACLVTPELGTVPWNVTSRDECTGVWMSHPLSRGCVKRDVPTKQRANTLLLGHLQTLQNLRGPRMESGWHNVTKASPKKKTHEGLQTRILNPFCIGWQRGRILADRTGEST